MINFRKVIFYLNDNLRDGMITKHLKDINGILNEPESLNSKNEIEIRKNRLLHHSVEKVPFYRGKVKSAFDFSLESFPVINKNIIRDSIDEFVTDGTDLKTLIKVVTSGSTGTPFSVYQDINKKARNSADTIYFGKQAGFDIGIQLNYLKIWTKVNRKSGLRSWLENVVPIDVTQLSDNEINRLVKQFKSNKSECAFLGYASALESICRYLDMNDPETRFKNVTAIIAMSEGISQYAKKSLEVYFGRQPVSRYSNVENGIIAQQKNDSTSSFVINWASYCVEILEMNSDNQVALGQPGRIVVTDYFNFAMPLIRYDTGDVGIMDWDENHKRMLLTKVEGRKMDMVFNTSGDLVSSFTITNNMWLYPEIKQYQFIQLNKSSYLFKLNLEEGFEREQLLISEFKNYFGQDANISVEYVNEIPLLNSGKRKKVMNLSL